MLTPFRKSGLSAHDVIAAGAALVLALVVMGVALSLAWYPEEPWKYVFALIVSAIAWPVSRVLPKTVLGVAAVIVAAPFVWGYGDFEIRVLPLAVAGFRAAAMGSTVRFVVPVTAGAALFALLPAGSLATMMTETRGGGIHFEWAPSNRIVVEWISDPSRHAMIVLVLTVILALGFAIKRLRVAAGDLASRNEELLVLQASESERVAAEVRTAIARDIHDVVAHHVAAMVVRAQAADSVADREPERLREAVQAIVADGNDALTAMRRAVHMMRSDSLTLVHEPAAFSSAVEVLAGRLRSSGRQVHVEGEIPEAGERATVAVLWIVQEALTNVLLHSEARDIRVRFSASTDSVGVTVEDDGPGVASTGLVGGGNGVRGMTERAFAVGGSLSAGPRAGGGWSVRALLPLMDGRGSA